MKTVLNKKKKGVTVLELSVVIAVLLSLIAILFMGAREWRKGVERVKAEQAAAPTKAPYRATIEVFGYTSEGLNGGIYMITKDGFVYARDGLILSPGKHDVLLRVGKTTHPEVLAPAEATK